MKICKNEIIVNRNRTFRPTTMNECNIQCRWKFLKCRQFVRQQTNATFNAIKCTIRWWIIGKRRKNSQKNIQEKNARRTRYYGNRSMELWMYEYNVLADEIRDPKFKNEPACIPKIPREDRLTAIWWRSWNWSAKRAMVIVRITARIVRNDDDREEGTNHNKSGDLFRKRMEWRKREVVIVKQKRRQQQQE